MTDEKLNKITSQVADTIEDALKILMSDDLEDRFKLIDIIASLHNELYREVRGKYYDYMFHWANLGYGGSPNDSLFKCDLVDEDES